MTDQQINEMIETARNNGANADSLAKMEVALRYFSNEDFRAKLQEFTFQANNQ